MFNIPQMTEYLALYDELHPLHLRLYMAGYGYERDHINVQYALESYHREYQYMTRREMATVIEDYENFFDEIAFLAERYLAMLATPSKPPSDVEAVPDPEPIAMTNSRQAFQDMWNAIHS